MQNLNLPQDLVKFFRFGKQLTYNPERCEVGCVKLFTLSQLSLGRVYVDSEESPLAKNDPHVGEYGYYSVPAVDLVASCEGYNPKGILIWLPDFELFGTWDGDHWDVRVFPGVTWTGIVSNPIKYINAQWYPDEIANEFLVPWHKYPFKEGRPWD